MIERYSGNPILTRSDIPPTSHACLDVSSVFNPGAIRFGDQIALLLRVQNRGRETLLFSAFSGDGIHFSVSNDPVHITGLTDIDEKIFHIYDPRLTEIDGRYYALVAMDMESGCYLGLLETENMKDFRFKGIVSEHPSRNGVLFPEKVFGKYVRLERPNQTEINGGVFTGDTIFLATSDDLLHWELDSPIISGRAHFWDELIGSGPPPIKTREGWLHLYHGIATHFSSSNIYQVGVVLLDLDDPRQVIARSRYNILEPREIYELVGQVMNVVFPSGMIVEDYDREGFAKSDSEVKIYYGAADTVVGLGITTVQELLDACRMGE